MKSPYQSDEKLKQGQRLNRAFLSIEDRSVREEIVVFAEEKAKLFNKIVSPPDESQKHN